MTAPYVPTLWVNDQAPDIDAPHLNRLEDAAKRAIDGVISLEGSSASLTTRVGALEAGGGSVSYRRFTKDALSAGAKADGATDNTAILQALLDTVRDQRYGEVYLPGKPGDTYNSKGLYVPSGCRLVSDPGVILNIVGPSGHYAQAADGHWSVYVDGDIRCSSWDTDLVPSDGLMAGTQSRLDASGKGGASAAMFGGWDEQAHDITIENLTMVGGTAIFWAIQHLRLINFSVRATYFGVALNGLKNGNQGPLDYCSDVLIDGGTISNVGRNGYEVGPVQGCTIRGTTVDTVHGNIGTEQAPGAGIEMEEGSYNLDLFIHGNTIRNCCGAGIAFIRPPGRNMTADRCVVSHNTITNVATLQYTGGSGGYPVVGTQGAIWFNGRSSSGEEVIIVQGNHARNVQRGGFLAASAADPEKPTDHTAGGYDGQVVATGNVCKGGTTGQTGKFWQTNFLANNVGV